MKHKSDKISETLTLTKKIMKNPKKEKLMWKIMNKLKKEKLIRKIMKNSKKEKIMLKSMKILQGLGVGPGSATERWPSRKIARK